jgi:periplasmic divalent cation tolerance protein
MIQVQVTTADKQEALKIADHLVGEKLAACAQVVGPIVSTYRWKGKVEVADEWLVLIKTRTELYVEVETAVLKMHSYKNPEIIAIPIDRATSDYLSWVYQETKSPTGLKNKK